MGKKRKSKKYPFKQLHPRHYIQERKKYDGKTYTVEKTSYSFKSGAKKEAQRLRGKGKQARVFVSRRFGREHYYVYARGRFKQPRKFNKQRKRK